MDYATLVHACCSVRAFVSLELEEIGLVALAGVVGGVCICVPGSLVADMFLVDWQVGVFGHA